MMMDSDLKVATIACSILSYKLRSMKEDEFNIQVIQQIFSRVILPDDYQYRLLDESISELRQELDCLIMCCCRKVPALFIQIFEHIIN